MAIQINFVCFRIESENKYGWLNNRLWSNTETQERDIVVWRLSGCAEVVLNNCSPSLVEWKVVWSDYQGLVFSEVWNRGCCALGPIWRIKISVADLDELLFKHNVIQSHILVATIVKLKLGQNFVFAWLLFATEFKLNTIFALSLERVFPQEAEHLIASNIDVNRPVILVVSSYITVVVRNKICQFHKIRVVSIPIENTHFYYLCPMRVWTILLNAKLNVSLRSLINEESEVARRKRSRWGVTH